MKALPCFSLFLFFATTIEAKRFCFGKSLPSGRLTPMFCHSLIGFFTLIILRFSAVVLCFVDYGSLYKPGLISWALSVIVFIPGLYTMYSVKKYFGFLRAAGADHFDSKYRDIPFERRGIFKWTSNAMYTFAIGIPFSFAVATGSQSMFIVAIFTYISIWLHYFCTEKEDFKVIYGNN